MRSSAAICWETADGVKFNASAAAAKLPSFAALCNVNRCLVSNTLLHDNPEI